MQVLGMSLLEERMGNSCVKESDIISSSQLKMNLFFQVLCFFEGEVTLSRRTTHFLQRYYVEEIVLFIEAIQRQTPDSLSNGS
jgi:hypothetical protein